MSTTAGRTGRRPGSPDTRREVLDAGRAEFAARGYRAATIRGIAARAGVDPALVHHYFGTKAQLFAATLELPFEPSQLVSAVLADGVDGAGERLLRVILGVLDAQPEQSPVLALLRSVAAGDETAELVREFARVQIIGTIALLIPSEDPELRAELIASQVLGIAMVRSVLRLEPLASADREVLVAAYAPTIQRYLDGDLGA